MSTPIEITVMLLIIALESIALSAVLFGLAFRCENETSSHNCLTWSGFMACVGIGATFAFAYSLIP